MFSSNELMHRVIQGMNDNKTDVKLMLELQHDLTKSLIPLLKIKINNVKLVLTNPWVSLQA